MLYAKEQVHMPLRPFHGLGAYITHAREGTAQHARLNARSSFLCRFGGEVSKGDATEVLV